MGKDSNKTFSLVAILVIVVLGACLGFVVLKYQYGAIFESKKGKDNLEFKGYRGIPGFKVKEDKIEITEDLTKKLINNTLSAEYEDKTIRTFVADLNGDGQDEFIVSGFKKTFPGEFQKEGLLMVVTPTDETGGRKKIAELIFNSLYSREIENMGNDNSVVDIEGDGVSEIVLDLGANELGYNEFYGIFKVDFEKGTIDWLQMKAEYETVRNTEFPRGNANTGATAFEIKDVDGDGFLDVEETVYPPVHETGGEEMVNVYRWDGKTFVYERGL